MINVHAQTFTDFSHATPYNRHLCAAALSALVMVAAAYAWISGRVGLSKVCVKRIFYWSASSLLVGLIQWNISLRNHSLATYTIDASNSVPYRTRSWTSQLFQDIASTLFVPWGLARLIHYSIGDMVNLSSRGKINQLLEIAPPRNSLIKARTENAVSYEPISLTVNDCRVNGYIKYYSGEATSRWFFVNLGTGCNYESTLGGQINSISHLYDANVLVYNPMGIGESTGIPTTENLIAGYTAAFLFLQNDKGATEIISYGVSLGGMVQGMAHREGIPIKDSCQVILIEDRAPASVVTALNGILAEDGPIAKAGKLQPGMREEDEHPVAKTGKLKPGMREEDEHPDARTWRLRAQKLAKCPPWIPQGIVWLCGWNLKAVAPSDHLPDHNVTRVFLHPKQGLTQAHLHFEQIDNDEKMKMIADHEGLLRREDTCGYQMRSFLNQPRHTFFLTGGEHGNPISALFNPLFARGITTMFHQMSSS